MGAPLYLTLVQPLLALRAGLMRRTRKVLNWVGDSNSMSRPPTFAGALPNAFNHVGRQQVGTNVRTFPRGSFGPGSWGCKDHLMLRAKLLLASRVASNRTFFRGGSSQSRRRGRRA